MSNIATTIEQSKELVRLGLDPKTADMFWMDTNGVKPCLKLIDDGIFNHRNYLVRFPNSSLPAWSITALLEVMPKDTNETYHLFSSMMSDQLGSWVCDRSKYYMDADGHNKNDYECFKSNNPVTAAYEMVCWLLEQGFIKKGGEQ